MLPFFHDNKHTSISTQSKETVWHMDKELELEFPKDLIFARDQG
jgi:hypothetical protein